MVKVAVDMVALTIDRGHLCVLLVQRGRAPFTGRWALPGGRVDDDEDAVDAARRELLEETGIEYAGRLEHVGTYAAAGRDPRGSVTSIAWLALLSDPGSPTAGSDAVAAHWWPVHAAPRLAFDHDAILRDGVERLRDRIQNTPLAIALCADEFTLPQLHAVYEAIWGARLDPRNFRREALEAKDFLRPTGRRLAGCEQLGAPAELFTPGDADTLHPPLRRPTAGLSAPGRSR